MTIVLDNLLILIRGHLEELVVVVAAEDEVGLVDELVKLVSEVDL